MTLVRGRRSWWRLAVALLALGAVVAACGDTGNSGGGADDPAAQEPTGDPDEGVTPQRGGGLVFAREAETANPWTPAAMLCDTACNQLIRGIYDPLVYADQDRELHPFLLESFSPNATYDEWTFVARDGVRFHDGTPFDADALVDHLDRLRRSPLGTTTLAAITDVRKVDEMTVVISIDAPWVGFPSLFGGQPGYVASPTWLAAVDAGEAEATEPVGTGPFVFAEYHPGDNFRMTRNPNYWLEAPDGQPYPYLDEIEFVVMESDDTRTAAVRSGDVDVTHTDRASDIVELRELAASGTLGLYEMDTRPATTYLLLNVANEGSPLQDVGVRRAMAQALDQDFRNRSLESGVFPVANGPYAPGWMGYLEDTGFPQYDPDAAAEFVAEYEAEHGPIVIHYRATADPAGLTSVELVQQELAEVGIEVQVDQTEQGEYILQASLGNFEVVGWRGDMALDPALARTAWHSDNSAPIGQVALNFGRFQDGVIDANLAVLRASPDEDERREAAEAINRRFGEQVYNIWSDWAFWAIPHQPGVHGLQTPVVLPDGAGGIVDGPGGAGIVGLSQLWVEG